VTWLFAGSCRRRITECIMSARHCQGIEIAGVMRKQQAVLPRMAWRIVAIVQHSVLSRVRTKCVKHFYKIRRLFAVFIRDSGTCREPNQFSSHPQILFSKAGFYFILPSERFSDQPSVCICQLSYSCHTLLLSHSPKFGHSKLM